ncbi:hypothetical protein [Arthrobacter sp. 92]|uniref:hypothetical protein n=1 Tax=Arthrobacter sp. 92 TaxID=3418175 RepID=UPI003CFEB9D6
MSLAIVEAAIASAMTGHRVVLRELLEESARPWPTNAILRSWRASGPGPVPRHD